MKVMHVILAIGASILTTVSFAQMPPSAAALQQRILDEMAARRTKPALPRTSTTTEQMALDLFLNDGSQVSVQGSNDTVDGFSGTISLFGPGGSIFCFGTPATSPVTLSPSPPNPATGTRGTLNLNTANLTSCFPAERFVEISVSADCQSTRDVWEENFSIQDLAEGNGVIRQTTTKSLALRSAVCQVLVEQTVTATGEVTRGPGSVFFSQMSRTDTRVVTRPAQ